MAGWLFADLAFLGVLIGIVIIDLSFDLPIVLTDGLNAQHVTDAVQYYVHAKASALLHVFIPALIVALSVCPVARLLRYGATFAEITHLVLLALLAPLFLLVVGPAGQAIADNPAMPAQAVLGHMKSIAVGHVLILLGASFGLLLHSRRFVMRASPIPSGKKNK